MSVGSISSSHAALKGQQYDSPARSAGEKTPHQEKPCKGEIEFMPPLQGLDYCRFMVPALRAGLDYFAPSGLQAMEAAK